MAQPVPQSRPGVVSAAGAALLVVALAGLASTIGVLVAAGQFHDRFASRAEPTDATQHDVDDVGSGVRSSMLVLAVITLLLALVAAGIAVAVLRRSTAGRIGAWVVCGAGLICGCLQCSAAGTITSDVAYNGDPDRIDVASQLTRAVQDALPGWLAGLLGTAAVIQLLGYILVAVLLGLPPANRWFRRPARPAPWPAPVPGGAPWPAPSPYPPPGPPPAGPPAGPPTTAPMPPPPPPMPPPVAPTTPATPTPNWPPPQQPPTRPSPPDQPGSPDQSRPPDQPER
jgi:hypothetical protein